MTISAREQQQRDFFESLNLVKSLTPNQVSTTVANISITLLAANANRKKLFIRNFSNSNSPIYIHFGSTTATLTNGVPIIQGETYEPPFNTIFTGAIQAISATSTAKDIYIEEWS